MGGADWGRVVDPLLTNPPMLELRVFQPEEMLVLMADVAAATCQVCKSHRYNVLMHVAIQSIYLFRN